MSLGKGITLTMIARNNEGTIRRCLESVTSAVEEIVVVDTGSTDDTPKIAESLGARIERFTWCDDFAAARNCSLEHVRTEWTFWLDTDEWMLLPETIKLREAVQQENAAGYELIRRNHFPDGTIGAQAIIRLWRTHPNLRMEGRIHEQIMPEAWMGAFPEKKVFRSNVYFEHDGFSATDPTKAKRNLPLLLESTAEDPRNLYMLAELYATQRQLGLESEAAQTLENAFSAVQTYDPNDRQPGFSAAHILRVLLLKGYDVERYIHGWYTDVPEMVLHLAQASLQGGDLERAYQLLFNLEQKRVAGEWNAYIPTDLRKMETALATNLALVAHQLGHAKVARTQYNRLLEIDPGNALATNNLAHL